MQQFLKPANHITKITPHNFVCSKTKTVCHHRSYVAFYLNISNEYAKQSTVAIFGCALYPLRCTTLLTTYINIIQLQHRDLLKVKNDCANIKTKGLDLVKHISFVIWTFARFISPNALCKPDVQRFRRNILFFIHKLLFDVSQFPVACCLFWTVITNPKG